MKNLQTRLPLNSYVRPLCAALCTLAMVTSLGCSGSIDDNDVDDDGMGYDYADYRPSNASDTDLPPLIPPVQPAAVQPAAVQPAAVQTAAVQPAAVQTAAVQTEAERTAARLKEDKLKEDKLKEDKLRFRPQTTTPGPQVTAATPLVRAVEVFVRTGNDDLRADDQGTVKLFLSNGVTLVEGINEGFTLAPHSEKLVRFDIPSGVDPALIDGFELCGTMTGGLGGDNWDVDSVLIRSVGDAGLQVLLSSVAPLVRLTGEQTCASYGL